MRKPYRGFLERYWKVRRRSAQGHGSYFPCRQQGRVRGADVGQPWGYRGCVAGGMFAEGRPGGHVMRHGARSSLPGVGDVPGMGMVGCPGSQTGVSASSGTGHGRRRGLLPPRERGGRGREEPPWPRVSYRPPSPRPQRPGTDGLTRHHCTGHGQRRTGPGGGHRGGSWGEHPSHARMPMASSTLGRQRHRDKPGAASRDPGLPVAAGIGTHFG